MSHDHLLTLIWLGGPLAVAVLLTAVGGARFGHWPWLLLVGVLLAAAVVFIAYLQAPPDYQHSNGTEGEMFLGRWWDPNWVVAIVGIGYFSWTVGVFVGFALRLLGQRPVE